MASITASGALVTLILALAAATTADNKPNLPGSAEGLVTTAVAVLVVSAIAALATFAPRAFYPYDVSRLADELVATWSGSENDARLKEVSERLEQLKQLQDGNNSKGALLLVAVILQFVGLGVLAAAAMMAIQA
ncbi:hypothetical protein [Modestobacter sp. I12A-02662]|uniref:hypothetical protein n=1 Tax=Modestobacter sp. I12A-02662 TaxID=1730496 RepID=UPI0034DFDDFB